MRSQFTTRAPVMIQNQRQYRVTKGQVSRLKAALTAAKATKAKMPARVYKAMVRGIESQIEDLTRGLQVKPTDRGARG